MAIDNTLKERQKTHGSFAVHSTIAQELKQTLRGKPGAQPYQRWTPLSSAHKEALEMICHKMARILAGNANEKDHWHDIQGYAKLAEDSIKTVSETKDA